VGLKPNKSFWKDKKVLLTGHTGFKGSWLCLWLKHLGANLSGLSLPGDVSKPNLYNILGLKEKVNDQRGNIIDFDFCCYIVEKVKPDIIIHMAAQPLVRESYATPWSTFNTNVMGTTNILEAARSCNTIKAIIVVTSDKCYKNVEKDKAFVETDSLGGYDPYSGSKACAEIVATAYYQSFFKNKFVGLATARAGNVIGGGDWSADRLIPDAVKAWSRNEKLIIRYPKATRPWQHLLEPLSGYLTLTEHLWKNPDEFSGPWNFGPDNNSVKTVQDTVELAVREWGGPVEWESANDNHLYEATLLHLNSDKAQSMLGWKPYIDFDKAVLETISWYREFYSNNQDLKKLTLDQLIEYENIHD